VPRSSSSTRTSSHSRCPLLLVDHLRRAPALDQGQVQLAVAPLQRHGAPEQAFQPAGRARRAARCAPLLAEFQLPWRAGLERVDMVGFTCNGLSSDIGTSAIAPTT
jgi:hypothetical protein